MSPSSSLVSGLASRYGEHVRQFLRRRLGRHRVGDAEDLAQEVFLQLVRSPPTEAINNPEGYLTTAAIHVLSRHRRRSNGSAQELPIDEVLAQTHDQPSQLVVSERSGPEAQVDRAMRMVLLNKALQELPATAAAALVLHSMHGLTVPEIAEELGVTKRKARYYLAQAAAHCRLSSDPSIWEE